MALWLLACTRQPPGDPKVTEETGQTTGVVDADGDGFDVSSDCDDSNDAVYPGALESCNGVDEDCDGNIDNDAVDAQSYHPDDDADGYGIDDVTLRLCVPVAGFSPKGGDCDDTNPAIHPAAEDLCNGVDDDCDQDIDEAGVVYGDVDGDGWGDPEDTTPGCTPEKGQVTVAGDCDDADGAIRPMATEVCGNHTDENCSGGAPGCGDVAIDLVDAPLVVYGDTEGAGLGWRVAAGADTLVVSAPRDEGLVWLLSADDRGVGTGQTVQGQAPGDRFGTGLALQDGDNNGVPDLLVGAPGADGITEDEGATYLFMGPISAGTRPEDADITLFGLAPGDQAGSAVAWVDTTPGGPRDLLVGAPKTGGKLTAGSAYLVLGPISGTLQDATVLVGETGRSEAGGAVSDAGDFNGDGVGDLLVGAPRFSPSSTPAGAVYVVSGDTKGTLVLSDALFTAVGEDAIDELGSAVAAAGDLDGDGLDDVVVGAPYNPTQDIGAGAAYLVPGGAKSGELVHVVASTVVRGETGNGLGTAVGAVDDLLWVGAPGGDGQAFSVAPAPGTLSVADAVAEMQGHASGMLVGQSLAGVPDVDGDGQAEVWVGGPGFDGQVSDVGAAGLLLSNW